MLHWGKKIRSKNWTLLMSVLYKKTYRLQWITRTWIINVTLLQKVQILYRQMIFLLFSALTRPQLSISLVFGSPLKTFWNYWKDSREVCKKLLREKLNKMGMFKLKMKRSPCYVTAVFRYKTCWAIWQFLCVSVWIRQKAMDHKTTWKIPLKY